jgi:hypothetical protein
VRPRATRLGETSLDRDGSLCGQPRHSVRDEALDGSRVAELLQVGYDDLDGCSL